MRPKLDYTTAYQLLDRAQQLLQHGWVQGRLAVDAHGSSCEPYSEKAQAWCEIGAIQAVTHYLDEPLQAERYLVSILHAANATSTLPAYRSSSDVGGIPAVNDTTTTTKEHVIRMLARAKQYLTRHFGVTQESSIK